MYGLIERPKEDENGDSAGAHGEEQTSRQKKTKWIDRFQSSISPSIEAS